MNFDDSAHRQIVHVLAGIDSDIVHGAIGGIDHDEMPVIDFIVQSTINDPPGNHSGSQIARVINRIIGSTNVEASLSQSKMHRLDDVAALAYAPQRFFEPRCKPPSPRFCFLGQPTFFA